MLNLLLNYRHVHSTVLTLSYIVKRSDFWDVLYCNINIRDVYDLKQQDGRSVDRHLQVCYRTRRE